MYMYTLQLYVVRSDSTIILSYSGIAEKAKGMMSSLKAVVDGHKGHSVCVLCSRCLLGLDVCGRGVNVSKRT